MTIVLMWSWFRQSHVRVDAMLYSARPVPAVRGHYTWGVHQRALLCCHDGDGLTFLEDHGGAHLRFLYHDKAPQR